MIALSALMSVVLLLLDLKLNYVRESSRYLHLGFMSQKVRVVHFWLALGRLERVVNLFLFLL